MIHYINYMEIWKDIPDYEGFYQVSNLGNVRSLDRVVVNSLGYKKLLKGKILSQKLRKDGYKRVVLCDKRGQIEKLVHILLGICFLGHKLEKRKIVIDHKKEGNKSNNSLKNLQIITQRENASKCFDKTKTSSKYTGVSWYKSLNKWKSQIQINGKTKHLGYFTDEYEAHLAYQNKLKEING
jgi:hypothetical protein